MILFTGVHGVGKGYFLKRNPLDGVKYYTASSLIKKHINEEFLDKRVDNVSNNQNILLEAIIIERELYDSHILLDGHLCLINSNNQVERISEQFLLDAKIDLIILLQDKCNEIEKRLMVRDGKTLSTKVIEEIQIEEEMYVNYIYKKYGIPFIKISHECKNFNKLINNVLGVDL